MNIDFHDEFIHNLIEDLFKFIYNNIKPNMNKNKKHMNCTTNFLNKQQYNIIPIKQTYYIFINITTSYFVKNISHNIASIPLNELLF